MVATVEFKRRIAGVQILGIVVGKLSYCKEPSLIILFIIDKNSEIDLYYTVLPVDLAISLKVKNSKKFLLNSKKVI